LETASTRRSRSASGFTECGSPNWSDTEAKNRYHDGNYGHDCAERAVEDAPKGWHRPVTKYHIDTAGNGVPVACIATAANVNDTLFFERWFLAVFAVMARIRAVFADSDQQRRKLVRDGSQFLALASDLPGADIGAAGHLANPPAPGSWQQSPASVPPSSAAAAAPSR
jgi:hypothetical protein